MLLWTRVPKSRASSHVAISSSEVMPIYFIFVSTNLLAIVSFSKGAKYCEVIEVTLVKFKFGSDFRMYLCSSSISSISFLRNFSILLLKVSPVLSSQLYPRGDLLLDIPHQVKAL